MSNAVKAKHDIKSIGAAFGILGEFIEAAPYGSGHINDTYAAVYDQAGSRIRYIHQRINHLVFKDPPSLMQNIHRVTTQLQRRLALRESTERSRRTLCTLEAKDGLPYFKDSEGNFWRTYLFIENARTYDVVQSNGQATQAAQAFGEFQKSLADLPGGRLHETIPNFHNTPWRLANLEAAQNADTTRRLAGCRVETDYAMAQKDKVGRLLTMQAAGLLPERVTHNDTKLNNVMIDDVTGEGICVIDLDTVMPGLAAYDFGDMVRTATMPVKEDERDLSKVVMQWDKFEALTRGYLSSAGSFLNSHEKETLPFAGWLITFEIGMRFLTDHLSGDSYFKIQREGQNLDRARTQFALARDIEKNLPKMQALVDSL